MAVPRPIIPGMATVTSSLPDPSQQSAAHPIDGAGLGPRDRPQPIATTEGLCFGRDGNTVARYWKRHISHSPEMCGLRKQVLPLGYRRRCDMVPASRITRRNAKGTG
jgi:hypothetical protein